MSRVITFSTKFPAHHPNAGQDTGFVQKFWTSIKVPLPVSVHAEQLEPEVRKLMFQNWTPKHHTIRLGNRWKVGDKFSPRIWSGKPYNSKQLIISDDIEIKKIWEIEVHKNLCFSINGVYKHELNIDFYNQISMNDGLTFEQLLYWFEPSVPMKGQIICWNENIEY